MTRNGVSIRWLRDKTVTVLLALQGHRTSYDTDGNSPPFVIAAQSETGGETQRRRQLRAPKGLRGTRESHMIVCVTDHCNLASANKAPLWKKENTSKASLSSLMSYLQNCICAITKWQKVNS